MSQARAPSQEQALLQPGRPMPVEIDVNGEPRRLEVEPRRTLLDALRLDCGLTGTKKVCDRGNCGACTVLLDGEAVYACLALAVECDGHRVTTIEALAANGQLDALQRAFVAHDALQCGYCTPGQIMSLKALFDREPAPTEADIVDAVAGNLCRCGAYRNILDAASAYARDRARPRRSDDERKRDHD